MTDSFSIGLNLNPVSLVNILEPTNALYTRVAVNFSNWHNVSRTLYTNLTTISFNFTDLIANTYIDIPSYVLYDITTQTTVSNNRINPTATNITKYGTLSFLPGNMAIDISNLTIVQAFPAVTYLPFAPTYEPASLSKPILYRLNMRS